MPHSSCRFYLLERKGYDYTLIEDKEVHGYTIDSVKLIEDAARAAIKERLGLPSTANIKLDVYQVPQSLIPVGPLTYDCSASRMIRELLNATFQAASETPGDLP
jgi:hypothetical protein